MVHMRIILATREVVQAKGSELIHKEFDVYACD